MFKTSRFAASIVFVVSLYCVTILARTASPFQSPDLMTGLTASLASEVSRSGDVPLVLSLSYTTDKPKVDVSSSFLLILLDKNGRQVARHPFYEEAAVREISVPGKEASYAPKLKFDPYCKELNIGEKYQIVCLHLPSKLAASVWFKLVD